MSSILVSYPRVSPAEVPSSIPTNDKTSATDVTISYPETIVFHSTSIPNISSTSSLNSSSESPTLLTPKSPSSSFFNKPNVGGKFRYTIDHMQEKVIHDITNNCY